MVQLGSFFGFGAIALLLLCLVLALRDARALIQARLLAALAISLIALIWPGLPEIGASPRWISLSVGLVSVPNIGLLWLFCLSLLRDNFRMRAAEWAGCGIFSAVPLYFVLAGQGLAMPAQDKVEAFGAVPSILMVAHVFWAAISERVDDLVEARRRGRLWIVLAVLVAAVVSVASEDIADATMAAIVRNGIATFPAAFLLLLWLTVLRPDRLEFGRAQAVPAIDPRDWHLRDRLIATMEQDAPFLESRLSIGMLAERLSVPEHRLRALINGGMGHRNFASFLNRYRLDAAKAALADPARARETILAIAYDAGFSSLQTFNRVFREAEGLSPREYRSAALRARDRE